MRGSLLPRQKPAAFRKKLPVRFIASMPCHARAAACG